MCVRRWVCISWPAHLPSALPLMSRLTAACICSMHHHIDFPLPSAPCCSNRQLSVFVSYVDWFRPEYVLMENVQVGWVHGQPGGVGGQMGAGGVGVREAGE